MEKSLANISRFRIVNFIGFYLAKKRTMRVRFLKQLMSAIVNLLHPSNIKSQLQESSRYSG